MDIRTRLISTAEQLFDRYGFTATGMDRLTQAAGISSRTLYKHVGSKNALMARVLAKRRKRFFEHTDFTTTTALFASLQRWADAEGVRGCLFFRVQAETGGSIPEIAAQVAAYQAQLRTRIADLVASEAGVVDEQLTDQILALFEGATTAATYRGTAVIEAAHACALELVRKRAQQ